MFSLVPPLPFPSRFLFCSVCFFYLFVALWSQWWCCSVSGHKPSSLSYNRRMVEQSDISETLVKVGCSWLLYILNVFVFVSFASRDKTQRDWAVKWLSLVLIKSEQVSKMCSIVNPSKHLAHTGGSSLFNKKEWVIKEWPMCYRDITFFFSVCPRTNSLYIPLNLEIFHAVKPDPNLYQVQKWASHTLLEIWIHHLSRRQHYVPGLSLLY